MPTNGITCDLHAQLDRDENGRPGLLGDYQKRRRDGHCLYCNLTLIAACLAMGFPSPLGQHLH